MQVELHRYLELNADFSDKAAYIFVGTGALILFIGTLACCCTVKGQPSLLYMVTIFIPIIIKSNNITILYILVWWILGTCFYIRSNTNRIHLHL